MSERLNIRRITMPDAKEREPGHFRVEREITAEDWMNLGNALETVREKMWESNVALSLDFAKLARYMKLLDGKLAPSFGGEDWKLLETGMSYFRMATRKDQWPSFLEIAATFRLFDPKRDPGITQADIEKIEGYFAEPADATSPSRRRAAINMRILYPDREIIGVDDVLIEDARESVKDSRSSGASTGMLTAAFSSVEALRILAPNEPPPKLTEEAWKAAHAELDSVRKTAKINDTQSDDGYLFWEIFAHDAVMMKIAAAAKVEVDERGLTITMEDEKPEPETPQELPDTLDIAV